MNGSVLRWEVPIYSSEKHRIGGGEVVLTACRDRGLVEVWTREEISPAGRTIPPRAVRIFGTGHPLVGAGKHIGSAIDGIYAWHIFEVES